VSLLTEKRDLSQSELPQTNHVKRWEQEAVFFTAGRVQEPAGPAGFQSGAWQRKRRGDAPKTRLKQRLKWFELLNPHEYAISVIDL
jgi:hypothetical protein